MTMGGPPPPFPLLLGLLVGGRLMVISGLLVSIFLQLDPSAQVLKPWVQRELSAQAPSDPFGQGGALPSAQVSVNSAHTEPSE
jgi:hypothetical protein